ncbi:unnamed protein product [Amoebophrya sp. A120]|nr:unnamed protein product [Amoebophrya sp. A120]|eukprot:GSA120T00002475001.1
MGSPVDVDKRSTASTPAAGTGSRKKLPIVRSPSLSMLCRVRSWLFREPAGGASARIDHVGSDQEDRNAPPSKHTTGSGGGKKTTVLTPSPRPPGSRLADATSAGAASLESGRAAECRDDKDVALVGPSYKSRLRVFSGEAATFIQFCAFAAMKKLPVVVLGLRALVLAVLTFGFRVVTENRLSRKYRASRHSWDHILRNCVYSPGKERLGQLFQFLQKRIESKLRGSSSSSNTNFWKKKEKPTASSTTAAMKSPSSQQASPAATPTTAAAPSALLRNAAAAATADEGRSEEGQASLVETPHHTRPKLTALLFLFEICVTAAVLHGVFWRYGLLGRVCLAAILLAAKVTVVATHFLVLGSGMVGSVVHTIFCFVKAFTYLLGVYIPAQVLTVCAMPFVGPYYWLSSSLASLYSGADLPGVAATSMSFGELFSYTYEEVRVDLLLPWQQLGSIDTWFYNLGGSFVLDGSSELYYTAVNQGKGLLASLSLAAWAETYTGWSMKPGRWRKATPGAAGASSSGASKSTSKGTSSNKKMKSRTSVVKSCSLFGYYDSAVNYLSGGSSTTVSTKESKAAGGCSAGEWKDFILRAQFFAAEEDIDDEAADSAAKSTGEKSKKSGNKEGDNKSEKSASTSGHDDDSEGSGNSADEHDENATGEDGGANRRSYKNFFTGEHDEYEYMEDEEYERQQEAEDREWRRQRRREQEERRQRELEESEKEKERLATVFCPGIDSIINDQVEGELDTKYNMRIVRDEQFYRTFFTKDKAKRKREDHMKSSTTSTTVDNNHDHEPDSQDEQEDEFDEEEPVDLPDGTRQWRKHEVAYGSDLRFECAGDFRDALLRHKQVLSCEKDGVWSQFDPLACVHQSSCLLDEFRDGNLRTYSGTYFHPPGKPFQTMRTKNNGRTQPVVFVEHGQWIAPSCPVPDFVRSDTRRPTVQTDLSSIERLYCHDGNWEMVNDVEGFENMFFKKSSPPEDEDQDPPPDDETKFAKYTDIPDAEREMWTNQVPLSGCRRLLSCEDEKWIKISASANKKTGAAGGFSSSQQVVFPSDIGEEKLEAAQQKVMGRPTYKIVGRVRTKAVDEAKKKAEDFHKKSKAEEDSEDELDLDKNKRGTTGDAAGTDGEEEDSEQLFVPNPTTKQLHAVGAQRVFKCLPGHFPVFVQDELGRDDEDAAARWWKRAIAHYRQTELLRTSSDAGTNEMKDASVQPGRKKKNNNKKKKATNQEAQKQGGGGEETSSASPVRSSAALSDADRSVIENLIWAAEHFLPPNSKGKREADFSAYPHRGSSTTTTVSASAKNGTAPAASPPVLVTECTWASEFEFPKWTVIDNKSTKTDDSSEGEPKIFQECQESLRSLVERRRELSTRWLSGALNFDRRYLGGVVLAPLLATVFDLVEKSDKRYENKQLRKDAEYRQILWSLYRPYIMHYPEMYWSQYVTQPYEKFFFLVYSQFYNLAEEEPGSASNGGGQDGASTGSRNGGANASGGAKQSNNKSGANNGAAGPGNKAGKKGAPVGPDPITFAELFCLQGLTSQQKQARGASMVRKNFRELSKMYHGDKCAASTSTPSTSNDGETTDVSSGGSSAAGKEQTSGTSTPVAKSKPTVVSSPPPEEDFFSSVFSVFWTDTTEATAEPSSGSADDETESKDASKSPSSPGGTSTTSEPSATTLCRERADKRFALLVAVKERLLSSHLAETVLRKSTTGNCDSGFRRCRAGEDTGEAVTDWFSMAEIRTACKTLTG